jgi:acyl-CoA synthetase (NDP forming)
MAITSVERTQNNPIFKAIVSFGNKSDVNVPDLLKFYLNEPAVEVVAMYIEGLGDGEGRGLFEPPEPAQSPSLFIKRPYRCRCQSCG